LEHEVNDAGGAERGDDARGQLRDAGDFLEFEMA
jgi:hypothetical protein